MATASICVGISILSSMFAPAPPYELVDMGLLPRGGFSKAHAISDSGLVVGEASVEPDETFYGHSVLWDQGRMTDLTGLGLSGSRAHGVNNSGVVVGFTDEFSLNAYRWSDGELAPLPVIPDSFSSANDVDLRGRIVGHAPAGTFGAQQAVIWDGTRVMPLGTLGGFSSDAYAINNLGIVVGESGVPSGQTHAFLWDGAKMHDLGTLGGMVSIATDVNDLNEVVGWTFSPTRAFLWRDGVMEDLGTLGGLFAGANAINNHSTVVGYSYLASQPGSVVIHAFVWRDGRMEDLNDLIAPGSGWTLGEAMDINNKGQIVGSAWVDGQNRGFILNPILPSEPADLNGDGMVNGLDLALLLGAWGPCPIRGMCAADLNDDGAVSGVDLAMLLATWGPIEA